MYRFNRARNPNDSTFYVLRYAADYADGGFDTDPFQSISSPFLSDELFYDEDRHVTELRLANLHAEARLPKGIVVEPGGDIFRVNRSGHLVRRFL